MAFAIGHISGCHLNPAVSFGLWAGGRFPAKDLVPYVVAQVLGAVAAGGVLYLIASGKAGFDVSAGFASNGYGAHSPGGYGLGAALITEVVMTMMFLFVILGATDARAPQGFAPIAIGLCLTLIHLISIPVTNTSVNPARSTGVAVFAGGWAMAQLWLFWVAPIIGGVIGAAIYRFIGSDKSYPAQGLTTPPPGLDNCRRDGRLDKPSSTMSEMSVKGGENPCHFQRSKTIPVSAVYQPAFLNLPHLFFLKMIFLWIFLFCLCYVPRSSISAPGQSRRSWRGVPA